NYFGKSIVEVLAPITSTDLPYRPELSANNNSVVLKITHHHNTLLWPGDLEAVGERLLLAHAHNLGANILKAPHHGSKTSSTENFIKQVKPDVVIYSTGLGNKFN